MQKKLYRSRDNRMIAGVCGGLGEYFEIDPTLIRLAMAFFSLWSGGGILLYFIAWFLIPEAPEEAEDQTPGEKLLSLNQTTEPDDESGE